MPDWIHGVNTFAWATSNLLSVYIAAALVLFVSGYYILFDPYKTTAGKFIFRFSLSLLGIMVLVFIGTWVNPPSGRVWYEYPGDVFWWRPLLRLIVYGFAAFTVSSLTVLLIIRKWFPHKLRTAKDYELVKTRPIDLIKARSRP